MLSAFIDPGIRDCGVSVYFGNVLQKAKLVVNPVRDGNDYAAIREMAQAVVVQLPNVALLGIEYPRVRPPGRQTVGDGAWADPNDLLPLVGVGSAIAALLPDARVVRYFPDEWKGTLDKLVMNDRAMRRLTPAERANVEAKDPDPNRPRAKAHNVWDAVGIGLHHHGRLDRVRVFPR